MVEGSVPRHDREPAEHDARRAPLRGRDGELAVIGELADRLRTGASSVAVIVGGAGSGKTRLLREGAAVARRSAIRVGVAGARPDDRVIELSALTRALFGGRAPLLPAGAVSDPGASAEHRYWVLHDVRELLERAALDAPLMVCLDDLQWADPGTLAALRTLPSELAGLPIGWLLTSRPKHDAPGVAEVVRQLRGVEVTSIALGPLDRAAVAQVTADAFGAPPSSELLELVNTARGDPFTLAELLSGLREEQLVHVDGGRAQLVSRRLPARLRDGMRDRLARLDPAAREAAVAAASLESRFSTRSLAAMLAVPPEQVQRSVEVLLAAELLRHQGEQLAFWHDITREAVRAGVPGPLRRALDRQAADVLMAEGARPVEVAVRLAASAEPGDDQAITTLRAAATALRPTDPGAAADLGLKALELTPNGHPGRAALVADTAVWLHAAGRIEAAQRFADGALVRGLDVVQQGEVRLSIAGLLELPPDLLVQHGRAALALPGLGDELRGRHLLRLAWNLFIAARYDEAAEVLGEARRHTGQDPAAHAQFTLDLLESGLEQADDRFGEALQTLERALVTGPGERDDARLHIAAMWRFAQLLVLDRLDEALTGTAEAIARARHDRQAWALAIYELMRGRVLDAAGQPAEALAALDERLPMHVAETGGVIHAAGLAALSRSATHLGDAEMGARAIALAERMALASTPGVRRLAHWTLAQRAMADGDAAGAHAWLCTPDASERFEVLRVLQSSPTDDVTLARIAVSVEDDALAQYAIERSARRAERNPDVATIAGVAAHVRGLVRRSPEDLERAVTHFGRGPRPLALASALEDLGVARQAARPEATAALDRSLKLWSDAGAVWDSRRVRRRLRVLGVRRRPVSAERPQSGWAAMTESEAAVAKLVAGGLTNRQVADRLFVSPHTVNSHLRRVFAKLQISSRVELARLVAERGPGGEMPGSGPPARDAVDWPS